jgi:hypothetical protein
MVFAAARRYTNEKIDTQFDTEKRSSDAIDRAHLMNERASGRKEHISTWWWLLLVATIAAVAWWVGDQRPTEQPLSPNSALPTDASALNSARIVSALPAAKATGSGDRTKTAAMEPVNVPPKSSLDEGMFEVCGIGKWRIKDGGIPPPPRMSSSTAVLHAVLNELLQSKSEVDRALGLYLKASLAGKATTEEMLLSKPGCFAQKDTTCRNEVHAAESAAIRASSRPLIELANETKDPAVYAAAMHRCNGMMGKSPCDALKPERFLALDPQNGFANLVAANELASNSARSRDGVADLKRAGTLYSNALASSKFDLQLPQFARILDASAVREQPIFMIHSFTDWLLIERRRLEHTANQEPVFMCKFWDVFGSSNEPQPKFCSTVDAIRAKHPANLSAFRDAVSELKTQGLSPEKLLPMETELKLLERIDTQKHGGPYWFSCEGMARDNPYNAEILRHGQLHVLRKLAAKKDVGQTQ